MVVATVTKCQGCGQENPLETHHWFDLDGNYHELYVCNSCNGQLGSLLKRWSKHNKPTHTTGLTREEQLSYCYYFSLTRTLGFSPTSKIPEEKAIRNRISVKLHEQFNNFVDELWGRHP